MKRLAKGGIPYLQFLQAVQEEITEVGRRPLCTLGPLGQEVQACEMAKRVIAYTVQIIMQRGLADMMIDVYAMERVTARVLEHMRIRPGDDVTTELDMTYVFVASANQDAHRGEAGRGRGFRFI